MDNVRSESGILIVSRRSLLHATEEVFSGLKLHVCNPLVYTNASRFFDAAFSSWLHQGNIARVVNQASVVLGRYKSGVVLDGCEGFLVLSEGVLVNEQVAPWIKPVAEAAYDRALGRAAEAPLVKHPCFLASRFGETTWGHWLVDILPKVVIAEALHPSLFTFVVPAHITSPGLQRDFSTSVVESLEAYGIARHRLLQIRNLTSLRFENLYDVDGWISDGIHPAVLDMMREQVSIQPRLPCVERLGVLRNETEKRPVYNLPDVRSLLFEHGFGCLDVGRTSFADQVHLFRSAEVILGDLGSNLACIIFAKRNLKVVTLGPSGWEDGFFVNILQRLSAHQADIRGASTFLGRGVADSSYVVSTQDVEAGLSRVLSVSEEASELHIANVDGEVSVRVVTKQILRINFGKFGNSNKYRKVGGWSQAEEYHAWSIGHEAALHISDFPVDKFDRTPDGDGVVILELKGISLIAPPDLPIRSLAVYANGVSVGNAMMTRTVHRHFAIPFSVFDECLHLNLTFKVAVCPSPSVLGVSNDDRLLGIGIIYLAFRCTRTPPTVQGLEK